MGYKEDFEFQRVVQENVVNPKIYHKVWPNIIEIDTRADELGKMFDLKAGIDKIVETAEGEMFGIAQRIQRRKWAYLGTVTWRAKRYHLYNSQPFESEFYKLQKALESGSLTARYQSHFYANADNEKDVTDILAGIIFDRLKAMKWISQNPQVVKVGKTTQGIEATQEFYYVKFDDIPLLDSSGLPIVIARYYEGGKLKLCKEYYKKG